MNKILKATKEKFAVYSKNTEGAVAVEFALTILPFLMLFLGAMETGRIMWSINSVQHALEETGRYASINPEETDASIEQHAKDILSGFLVPTDSLSVTRQTVTTNGVEFVEVESRYQINTILRVFIPEGDGIYDFTFTVLKPVL